jgi:glycosyltransferase involved in cell wall biosynthesis
VNPYGKVRAMISAMENHCRRCAEEIERKKFDIVFANACIFFRTSPVAQYLKIPSVLYLGEPYRWFYEAMPELPWISAKAFRQTSLREEVFKSIFHDPLQKGIQYQARKELEYARAFDLVLCNSIYSRESILRAYNIESKICYLGIDTDIYRPTQTPKEKLVVGLGTIYSGKGVDRAIKAIATIDFDQRPHLIWIGNGAFPENMKEYRRLAAENKVEFVPKIHIPDNEVVEILGKAAVMIYTSRLEPFGLAPLEANACGTPVVAIAEGGVKETVKNGVNGFLVDQDDPKEIGRLVSQFTNDLNYAKGIGKQARDYVLKNWNMENCTNNLEKVLLGLIHRSG